MNIDSTPSDALRQPPSGFTHRPQYHFLPPANWMNDPNGLVQWKGRYHLFYQYNPHGAFHGKIHWGHAASPDLVHWTHLPIALSPSPGRPDADGCWSGCAVIHDNIPTLIYTGSAGGVESACLATGDDDLLTWRKYADNPVIAGPPRGLELVGFRDHSVWFEEGSWYQALGAGIRDKGGAVLLYRSRDLVHWEYLHPLLTAETLDAPLGLGQMWECPDFFSIDNRHVLILSIWDKGRQCYSVAMTGEYKKYHFEPQCITKLDHGGAGYYAPQTMLDAQGRRLMWGWITEGRPRQAQIAAGWSGVMSLPRELKLDVHGILRPAFVPELSCLRTAHDQIKDLTIQSDQAVELVERAGDQFELEIELERIDCEQSALVLLASPGREEETRIVIDWQTSTLLLQRTKSSLDPSSEHRNQCAPLQIALPGTVKLQVYVDHSVLELIANQETMLTSRVYPTRSDSQGLALCSCGGTTRVRGFDLWHLQSIW